MHCIPCITLHFYTARRAFDVLHASCTACLARPPPALHPAPPRPPCTPPCPASSAALLHDVLDKTLLVEGQLRPMLQDDAVADLVKQARLLICAGPLIPALTAS